MHYYIKSILLFPCCWCCIFLTACSFDSPAPAETDNDSTNGGRRYSELIIDDPLEEFNRNIFWFNDQFDRYLMEPVAKGYDYVVPNVVQSGVNNFFDNLTYPVYLLSDLIQLKFSQAGKHTGRFLINSTAGVAGVLDVAQYIGLEKHIEDFGVALGYHGVPSGPYIVIPLLGPSNLRDLAGLIVDTLIYPTSYPGYFKHVDSGTATAISAGSWTLKLIQDRADLISTIKTAKESTLDFYGFVRAAYFQRRQSLITDGKLKEAPPEPDINKSDQEDKLDQSLFDEFESEEGDLSEE